VTVGLGACAHGTDRAAPLPISGSSCLTNDREPPDGDHGDDDDAPSNPAEVAAREEYIRRTQALVVGETAHIRECFEERLRRAPPASDEYATLNVAVDGGGTVTQVALGGRAVKDQEMGACLRRFMCGLRFPPSPGSKGQLLVQRVYFSSKVWGGP
jgi:hypothetical protein